MSIQVALHHRTTYRYDRTVEAGPQVIRLRPAPHARTPIDSYSLRVSPGAHFLNWQQDPHGNFLARVVFKEPIDELTVEVDLVANMSVINPFDFFVEEHAEQFPFEYSASDAEELRPYLELEPSSDAFEAYFSQIDQSPQRTNDFLVALNGQLEQHIDYTVRLEPGVQTPEETLTLRTGSCRDSAWLLVQLLRRCGLAARFTSGYLIQLAPDVKSLDGPSGAETDFTDLHAWAEVFLPGAGWIGLDPTSGLLTGEGHIPLASTPTFSSAAPITGCIDECETEFDFAMSVQRVHEDPRVTKPYTDEQWQQIDALGQRVDDQLQRNDVRLTMGGEPTFVSIDDMDSPEWQTEALGEHKDRLSNELMDRLKARFASSPLIHHGQGKWYPGEPLPRWSKTCYWRTDGQPLWKDDQLQADQQSNLGHTSDDAKRFTQGVAQRLGVSQSFADLAFEDVLYHLWQEQRLPSNVDLNEADYRDSLDRKRLARVLEQGLDQPVGSILPLRHQWWQQGAGWISGKWITRTERIFLVPGDSPMGYRLPLKSLVKVAGETSGSDFYAVDPLAPVQELPARAQLPIREQLRGDNQANGQQSDWETADVSAYAPLAGEQDAVFSKVAGEPDRVVDWESTVAVEDVPRHPAADSDGTANGHSNGHAPVDVFNEVNGTTNAPHANAVGQAMCVEPRAGTLHVFMPPLDRLESYVELLAAVEDTAAELSLPVVIEGYKPPSDARLKHFSVTPDPGVIEVNVQPASSWEELKDITNGVYHDARSTRLGTEKFELDGQHSGTGGGNHLVLGGATPADSPLLRRPDLLRSLIGFWQNHPSLSYLFSGRFIGTTSQAPRVDEGTNDSLYELQIAFDEMDKQIQQQGQCPPWIVDRLFRNLLTDVTGNTHRAEFCIDKLFSPDSSTGRLGLVEFRGFEMPPHEQMSLTQQLLLRCLIARFWEQPYTQPLVDWKTRLHDQFMLPHFVWRDFQDVIESCRQAGFALDANWFDSHFEFRFPSIGGFTHNQVKVDLRQAIEPWNTLGEETTGSGMSRYVDSSVERMQVSVRSFNSDRYLLSCNGREVPLHPTEHQGEYVAGVRYRAWQPPSCLHPTIPIDEPLTFDLFDRWLGRAVDGCRYHVGHPGGLNPETFPVNSYEAESRRAARFSRIGHSGTAANPRPTPLNRDFPMTLDLRKDRS